jgi:D-alanyl-D-alanine carboxypeptidase
MKFAKFILLTITTTALLLVSQLSHARHAAIMIDAENGEVLYDLEANQSWYPASLTKLMTLYMTFEALESGRLSLTRRLNVSSHAARQPTSKLGLRTWDSISTEDAIIAIITRSANDAAVVLGEAIGGSEKQFAIKMTTTAHRLGMYGSHFMNATGLPHDWQTTTAHDMGLLAMRIIRDFPQYYGYFGMESFYFNGRDLHGINKFVSHYPGAEGMKTGYTCGSGYNLVATANQYGKRLIGVVLGGMTSAERYEHMFMMMDMGFSNTPRSYRNKNINTMNKRSVGTPPYQLSCGHRPTSHYAANVDDEDDKPIGYVKKYADRPFIHSPKKPINKPKLIPHTLAKSSANHPSKAHPLHIAKLESKASVNQKHKTVDSKPGHSSTKNKPTKSTPTHATSTKSAANKAKASKTEPSKKKGYYVPPAKQSAKTVVNKSKPTHKTDNKSKSATKAKPSTKPKGKAKK